MIRAAGLALPAMVVAAPIAAVAARRRRAWWPLMAGLMALDAADLAANLPATWIGTLSAIAADRAAHGLAAGAALAASAALIWERARGATDAGLPVVGRRRCPDDRCRAAGRFARGSGRVAGRTAAVPVAHRRRARRDSRPHAHRADHPSSR